MIIRQKSNVSDYVLYCILYMTTALSNKFVLSSLGFQYPTIFQAWQTFVSLVLVQMFSGNPLKHITLSEIIPWSPAMLFYVTSIFSGSKALAALPVPVFLLSHGVSDACLMLCDNHLPSGLTHLSIPLKISGLLLSLWSVMREATLLDIVWVVVYSISLGAYKSVGFWYTSPQWPYSGLTLAQRQYLNNLFGFLFLLPTAILLGHHQDVHRDFPHLRKVNFYIGCFVSAVMGWAVKRKWAVISGGFFNARIEMVQLLAKVTTLIASMHIYPLNHTILLWISIFIGLSGDVLHIIGSLYEETEVPQHDMNDVLVGQ
uniref:Sugar phosphate transporter domain-containing protein n=1 Tax=Ciona savignyi TaxID=51511 RepID=H2Y8Y8_CIOSA